MNRFKMEYSNAKSVAAKICGLKDQATIQAAVSGGASYIGLVFYHKSPRYVTPNHAHQLFTLIPPTVKTVGLFVSPTDKFLREVLDIISLDFIQLHGFEIPSRIQKIKTLTGRPVIKAVKVAKRADVDGAANFDGFADMLLFDAKPPKDKRDALPGGNGLTFDWNLLANRQWRCPWMLSGGLNPENVGQAVKTAGAYAVDVSSGVETTPGHKDPIAIKAFLDVVNTL